MIEIFTSVFIVLSIAYYSFLFFILLGLLRLQNYRQNKYHSISVIVSARNEEKNLIPLINHLSNQNYPSTKYEIIIVNDRSSDNTETILKKYSQNLDNLRYVSIIEQEGNLVGKKNALDKAIAIANGEIIAFTDADCRPTANWLSAINRQFIDKVDVVVGYSPLVSHKNKHLLSEILFAIKRLERLSIFAISAGTIGWNWGVTCTARNFAYRKSVYNDIGGFSGIGHILSGDDDLMLQKISKSKRYNLHFVVDKDSYVPSIEDKSKYEQYQQEKRRASKWRYYPISIKLITSIIFVFYILIIYTFILIFTNDFSWILWLKLIVLKICLEFILMAKIALSLKETKRLWIFPLCEIFYIPYFLSFAILGTLKGYKWK
ncbi:MAG: hypothetical protein DRH57_08435 [Candidatus Cloacimonadota bacterium]|nr:MAG: hypothetical protein DRH57_08435 [Candidatus Cloacimonadota bacterium]